MGHCIEDILIIPTKFTQPIYIILLNCLRGFYRLQHKEQHCLILFFEGGLGRICFGRGQLVCTDPL